MELTIKLLIDQCIQTTLSVIPVTPFMFSGRLTVKWKVFLLGFAALISNLMDADHIRIAQNEAGAICISLGGRTVLHTLLGISLLSLVIFLFTLWQYYIFKVAAKENWIKIYHVLIVTWVTFSSLFMHLVWDARGKYGAMLFYPIENKFILSDEVWAITSLLIIITSLCWVGLEYIFSNKR